MAFFVIKRYGHEQGFSACFRQYSAKHSHCQYLHGYALAFELEFGCTDLDSRNWVIDFGGLKPVKEMLKDKFDHKLAVDQNDPLADTLVQLQSKWRLADVVLFENGVGCERFAEFVHKWVDQFLQQQDWNVIEEGPDAGQPRVWVQRVRVSEHNGNHAEYIGDLA